MGSSLFAQVDGPDDLAAGDVDHAQRVAAGALPVLAEGSGGPGERMLPRHDLNRDGATNVHDAILLLQHIVGLTEITECGPPAP